MGGKEPTYFLRARYLQAIQEAGGVPLVLPLVQGRAQQTFLMQRLDGLLVTGSGSDLAPQFYGERQQYPFQRMSDERAQLELGLSKIAFEHHVPTFGICGGMQSMNVALGGRLIQDIPGQIPTKIQHLQKNSFPLQFLKKPELSKFQVFFSKTCLGIFEDLNQRLHQLKKMER